MFQFNIFKFNELHIFFRSVLLNPQKRTVIAYIAKNIIELITIVIIPGLIDSTRLIQLTRITFNNAILVRRIIILIM